MPVEINSSTNHNAGKTRKVGTVFNERPAHRQQGARAVDLETP
jgi:hypothetical protein